MRHQRPAIQDAELPPSILRTIAAPAAFDSAGESLVIAEWAEPQRPSAAA